MRIDLSKTYVSLAADGMSITLPGGEQCWSWPAAEMEKQGHGWLVSEFGSGAIWPTWEMHPGAGEFVYLQSGGVTMILEIRGEPGDGYFQRRVGHSQCYGRVPDAVYYARRRHTAPERMNRAA